jgi:hypothetical protein
LFSDLIMTAPLSPDLGFRTGSSLGWSNYGANMPEDFSPE